MDGTKIICQHFNVLFFCFKYATNHDLKKGRKEPTNI